MSACSPAPSLVVSRGPRGSRLSGGITAGASRRARRCSAGSIALNGSEKRVFQTAATSAGRRMAASSSSVAAPRGAQAYAASCTGRQRCAMCVQKRLSSSR